MDIFIQNKKVYDLMILNNDLSDKGFSFNFIDTFKDIEILKILRKKRRKSAIYINELGNVNYVFRKNGSWKYFDKTIFDLFFAQKNGLIELTNNFDKNSNLIMNNFVEYLNKKERYDFFDGQDTSPLVKQILFLAVDDNWKYINSFCEKYGFLKIKISRYSKKNNYLESLINTINRGQSLPGIQLKKVHEISESQIIFSSNNTLVKIKSEDNQIESILISYSKTEVESFYLNKGMNENIKNNIFKLKTSQSKVKKRDKIISISGMVIFILLTIFCFTSVLKPENVEESFVLMFDKTSFQQPWIYLLWFNFFVTFFFSFIIMSFISFVVNGKKPNFNFLWSFFIAAQIKSATRFITGEEIIGTILWAWYLNKNTTVRTSTLIGSMATMSLIRIPLVFIIKTPFMIIGQVYASQIIDNIVVINDIDKSQLNLWLFYFLSWGGFIWELSHNSIIPIIILLPFAHKLFNLAYSNFLIIKKENNVIDKLTLKEMSLLSMKRSTKTLLRARHRIYRLSITIFLMIVLEALETMYIYKIVENYMFSHNVLQQYGIEHKANYSNFIQLSGIRLMVSNIHNFPIINVIPGNSMGVMEIFMKNVNEIVFISAHNNDISFANGIASDFAEQTAFISRFFNTYLRRLFSLVITIYVVIKIMTRKLKAK